MSAQRAIPAVLVLAGMCWLGSPQALANKAEKMQALTRLARVSMIDAIRIVENQTGGKVYKIELKEHDGRIYYQVEFVLGDETIKTQVDATVVPQAVQGARVVQIPAPRRSAPPPAPVVPAPSQEETTKPGPILPRPEAPAAPAAPSTPQTPMPPSGIVIPFDTEPVGGLAGRVYRGGNEPLGQGRCLEDRGGPNRAIESQ